MYEYRQVITVIVLKRYILEKGTIELLALARITLGVGNRHSHPGYEKLDLDTLHYTRWTCTIFIVYVITLFDSEGILHIRFLILFH